MYVPRKQSAQFQQVKNGKLQKCSLFVCLRTKAKVEWEELKEKNLGCAFRHLSHQSGSPPGLSGILRIPGIEIDKDPEILRYPGIFLGFVYISNITCLDNFHPLFRSPKNFHSDSRIASKYSYLQPTPPKLNINNI